jgi:putative ABC transport system permease protein
MAKQPSGDRIELVYGSLDMLILRTLRWGPTHGHGIAKSIERMSEETLKVEHGSLYPALQRLQQEGWITAEWGVSKNKQRAKYYRLTGAGRRQLLAETSRWERFVRAVTGVLRPAESEGGAMSWRREVSKLVALFRRSKLADDLEEEIRSHLAMEEQENLEAGMPPDEAHYAALRRFGNVVLAQEGSREMWGWQSLETLCQDVRYGLRQPRRNPGFTAVAVLTLALGIGANTAIFSAVNAVLLRPLPYQDSGRLVRVWATNVRNGFPHDVASYPDFTDWSAQNHSFQQVEAYRGRSYNLSGGDHPEQIRALQVTAGLLPMLGIRSLLGRDFLPEEQQPGRSHVVLLSEGLWRTHFGGSPKVLGSEVRLNEENYTVIGILPSRPEFPPDDAREVVVPLEPDLNRGHGFLYVLGRHKRGIALAEAQADMTAIAGRLQQQYPKDDKDVGIELQRLQASYVSEFQPALLILMGAVGFVLLIACSNVANLFLGGAAARQRELAVRASLGAGKARLIRQLLTESLLVGVAGGTAGLLLTVWGLKGLVTLLSRNFSVPYAGSIRIDGWVLAFTLVVSLVTGLVSGLAPALGTSQLDLNEWLKQGSRSLTGSFARTRFRSALAISEMALAVVLLSGAGLMIKSFVLLAQVKSGMHPENVLAVNFSLYSSTSSQTASRAALFQQILAQVATLPGVKSAAVVADVPLTHNEDSLSFSIEGIPDPPGRRRHCRFNIVGPGYFRTLGIPLVAGRDFTDGDAGAAPRVVLVNRAWVRSFWPQGNPIGQRVSTDVVSAPLPLGDHDHVSGAELATRPTWFSIIGIAGDVRQMGLRSESSPEVYVSYLQDPYQWPWMSLLVRAGADPLKLFPAIEQAVWSVDKDQPVSNPTTMDQIRSDSIAQPRVTALLLGLFAALALLLASVGLYGVMARLVTERTHEIGVRMALGAQRPQVFRLVVGQGMTLALCGAGLGLAGALAVTRALTSFLYGVRPTDPATFAAVSGFLVAVALLASYLPARRATKVDPMVALRYE